MPSVCPFHGRDGQSCNITLDHLRDRQTGPCFPLYVMRCSTHKLGFTVYPPGHVPYGRQRIAPVAPDGSPTQEKAEPHRQFESTIFDAALDAARHQLWLSESEQGSLAPRFPTQLRHLSHAAFLLGISPCLDQSQREEIGQILSIPGQILHDSVKHICEDRSCNTLGKNIRALLDLLPKTRSLFERLAEAGSVSGLWRTVQVWCGKLRIWRFSPFRAMRTRASPGRSDNTCNPTTSFVG